MDVCSVVDEVKAFLPLLAPFVWPLVVASALFGFRKRLGPLFDRMRKISREGAEFEAVAAQAVRRQTEASVQADLKDETIAPPDLAPVFLPLYEERVRYLPQNLPQIAKGWGTDERAALMRITATLSGELLVLKAYRFIFGSQMAAIQELQRRGGEGTRDMLKHYYEQAVTRHPAMYQSYSLEQWIGYMLLRGGFKLVPLIGHCLVVGADAEIEGDAPHSASPTPRAGGISSMLSRRS